MIYLDNQATTPCDSRVVKAMLPFFFERFANPSSEIHQMGRDARQMVERARGQVANLIGAEPKEIIFTSSATESNNIAILGFALAHVHNSRKSLVTSSIEHKSVLAPCHALEKEGFHLFLLPVNKLGHVIEDVASTTIEANTLLVSVQAGNNEIGTIQNVRTLSAMAHTQGAIFHCDAAQAVGKIPVNVDEWDVDLLSISAHKMYGPKGIAALYIRGGPSHSLIAPLMYGGDQEAGLRPGTLNVPLIVGFGEACQIAAEVMTAESKLLTSMRDKLELDLLSLIPGLKRNGDLENRLPNNSSLTFPGIDAEALIMSIPELMLSTSSACNSSALEPSYILKAINLSHEDAYSTLRVSLGRFNTEDEIINATKYICSGISNLHK